MSFKQAVTLLQPNRVKRPGRATSTRRKHARTLAAQAGTAGGRQDVWTASSWFTEINRVKRLKCSSGRCP